MPLTFEQALEFVSGLQHRGWRLGLDRMREFVVRAGLLNSIEGDLAPRFIHVAGTNGKGSTTAYVQSVLMSQGFRVGATSVRMCTTSPSGFNWEGSRFPRMSSRGLWRP